MAHLKSLFFDRPWPRKDARDGHDQAPWNIGNPFKVYRGFPVEARYRFLLENSELVVSGITYGPVCLGQTATFAIKDQFWVFFVDPKYDVSVHDPKLGLETWETFMDRSLLGNDAYEGAYGAALKTSAQGLFHRCDLERRPEEPQCLANRAASRIEGLSVMKGRQGGIPRTLWLMDYSGFERIYYDTVASVLVRRRRSSRRWSSSTFCARSLRTISSCFCRRICARSTVTTGPAASAKPHSRWSRSPAPVSPPRSRHPGEILCWASSRPFKITWARR